jgi:transposase-like protein
MQEGSVISQIAREYKLSSTTLYSWRSQYIKSQTLASPPDERNNFVELLPDNNRDSASLVKASFTMPDGVSVALDGPITTNQLSKILSILGQPC